MPVDRAEILNLLVQKCGLSSKEFAVSIGKSTKTIRRTLKELEALKLVDCYKDPNKNASGEAPWSYYILPEFASILGAPIPSQECMSKSKSTLQGPESYHNQYAEEDLVEFADSLNPDRKKDKDGIDIVPSNPFKKEPTDNNEELPF